MPTTPDFFDTLLDFGASADEEDKKKEEEKSHALKALQRSAAHVSEKYGIQVSVVVGQLPPPPPARDDRPARADRPAPPPPPAPTPVKVKFQDDAEKILRAGEKPKEVIAALKAMGATEAEALAAGKAADKVVNG